MKRYFGPFIGLDDSLTVRLEIPDEASYSYPGLNNSSIFRLLNLRTAEVIGEDLFYKPNFIHLRAGKGNVYFQLAPLAFSNYFILHKQNAGYFEKALSLVPAGTKRIVWDEYFGRKKSDDSQPHDKTSWLKVLWRYPAFRAGLLTAILALLLYVLLEMRRKQRAIPILTRPRNDSLDFVKTIGRLYYEKGDHANLARKMSAFFLEYVRTTYKLPTGTLDELFMRQLQYRTGLQEKDIKELIGFAKYVEDAPMITPEELKSFHQKLEDFYTKA
jgi:hypothetical protein